MSATPTTSGTTETSTSPSHCSRIVVLHDIGSRTEIARANNIQRIRDLRASVSALEFVLPIAIPGIDDDHVITIWECHIPLPR